MLTIVTTSNDHTIFFKQPIPKQSYIRLLSCSLYNSWYNPTSGKINLTYKNGNKKYEASFLPGHNTVESFAEALKDAFLKYEIEIITDVYRPTGVLYLKNSDPSRYDINISEELAELFDINQSLLWIRFVTKMTSPTGYFIHCDLIDKGTNLFNGKPSSCLANCDIKGKAFEKVFLQVRATACIA